MRQINLFRRAVVAIVMTLCMGFVVQICAQRKLFNGAIIVENPLELNGEPYKVKYNYIIDKNGERVKDGNYTINGNVNVSLSNGFVSAKETGNYKLSTIYKEGKLNGLFTVQANYNQNIKDLSGRKNYPYNYSFTGNFIKGVPNGNFVIKGIVGIYPAKVNVTYKNGLLVGTYYCNAFYERHRSGMVYEIKGTLTSTGELIGKWIRNAGNNWNNETFLFKNGVLIDYSSSSEETTLEARTFAENYADKTISKDELLTQGYVVLRDSLMLSDYIEDVIFSNSIAPWGKNNGITGYDFSQTNTKYFEKLKKLKKATDEEITMIINTFADLYKRREISDNLKSALQFSLNAGSGDKYGVFFEKYDLHCYNVEDGKGGYEACYLTDSQMQRIDSSFIEIKKKNALTMSELLKVKSKIESDFPVSIVDIEKAEMPLNVNKKRRVINASFELERYKKINDGIDKILETRINIGIDTLFAYDLNIGKNLDVYVKFDTTNVFIQNVKRYSKYGGKANLYVDILYEMYSKYEKPDKIKNDEMKYAFVNSVYNTFGLNNLKAESTTISEFVELIPCIIDFKNKFMDINGYDKYVEVGIPANFKSIEEYKEWTSNIPIGENFIRQDNTTIKTYKDFAENDKSKPAKYYKKSLKYLYGLDKDIINYQKAIDCLQKSIEKKYPLAMLQMGELYSKGYGVDKDLNKATEYYKMVAEMGDNLGAIYMAVVLYNGWGCEKDKEASYYWMKLASDNGDEYANIIIDNWENVKVLLFDKSYYINK